MKDKLIQLWEELQERRQLVLQAREKCPQAIGKQMFTTLANEHAELMDAIATIIEEDNEQAQTQVQRDDVEELGHS